MGQEGQEIDTERENEVGRGLVEELRKHQLDEMRLGVKKWNERSFKRTHQ